jgi:hypothetical protein
VVAAGASACVCCLWPGSAAARSAVRRNRLAATPLFTNGYHQAIGIDVLGDPSTKDLLRFLKAGDLLLHHPPVELIKIRNTQTGTAPPGRNPLRIVSFRIGPFTFVERQGRPVGGELGPAGRLESQRQSKHVSIERYSPLHVADKHNRIVHSHLTPLSHPFASPVDTSNCVVGEVQRNAFPYTPAGNDVKSLHCTHRHTPSTNFAPTPPRLISAWRVRSRRDVHRGCPPVSTSDRPGTDRSRRRAARATGR